MLLAVGGRAQDHADGLYSVAFYNLENLFDTIHDTGKNDYEYLPDAAKGCKELKICVQKAVKKTKKEALEDAKKK